MINSIKCFLEVQIQTDYCFVSVALLQMVFIFTGSRLASSRPSTLGRVAENITTLSLAHNPINLIYFIQIRAQVFELSCPVTFIDTTSVQ